MSNQVKVSKPLTAGVVFNGITGAYLLFDVVKGGVTQEYVRVPIPEDVKKLFRESGNVIEFVFNCGNKLLHTT